MKKIKIDKYLIYCIIITILLLGLIFRIQNIYPFGTYNVAFIDVEHNYVPTYYKLWDVLHFKSSPFFDWNLGAGLNSFGSMIFCGMISPLCWIIGLFPRNTIPYTVGYIFFIKIIFMSLLSYIGLKKIFPNTDKRLIVFFSLVYTFSAWTLLMINCIIYLDAVSLFPLLVYSLINLLKNGKWKLYLTILSCVLLLNYYIAWLDLIFIIGFSGFALLFLDIKNKKEKAVKILITTALSGFLSSILFFPGFFFSFFSTRASVTRVDAKIFDCLSDKTFYLTTITIPIIFTIKQLFVKKDKNINRFIIAMLLFLMIGILIEPINAMWHTGSHYSLPYRYSFQLFFLLSVFSIYYIDNNYKETKEKSLIRFVVPIAGILTAFLIFIVLKSELTTRSSFVTYFRSYADYICVMFIFLLLFISYVFSIKNNRNRLIIVSILLFIVQTIIFGTLYTHMFKYGTSTEIQKISDSFDYRNDGYNYILRTKTNNDNFPYILNVPSIRNHIHFINQEFINQQKYMGYDFSDEYIKDTGSNDFFNALLQVRYEISDKELPNQFYDLIDKKDNYNYYERKYYLNLLIPYNGKEYNRTDLDKSENANEVYKQLFGGEKNIYNKEEVGTENNNSLYMSMKKNTKYYLSYRISDITNLESVLNKNDNIIINHYKIDMETDVAAKVQVEFISKDTFNYKVDYPADISEAVLYSLDTDEFKNFIESNNKNDVKVEIDGITKKYTYNAKEDTDVLLPINYSKDYIVKVNGKVVDYKCNLYNMLSIKVKEGINTIEVTYNHKWFKLGIITSITTFILLIILYFINKKYRFINNKYIRETLFIASCLCFIGMIIIIYIYPVIITLF